MCGIAGLHLRCPDLYPRLGELLEAMLLRAAGRGNDSAGVGLYADPATVPPGQSTICLLAAAPAQAFAADAAGVARAAAADTADAAGGARVAGAAAADAAEVAGGAAAAAAAGAAGAAGGARVAGAAAAGVSAADAAGAAAAATAGVAGAAGGAAKTAAELVAAADPGLGEVTAAAFGVSLVLTANAPAERLEAAAATALPGAPIVSRGQSLTVLKGAGEPAALAADWRLADRGGWQGVAHTRMATESAVTPGGSHPFSVGSDQCLVHNGSFSNHEAVRKTLIRKGVRFDSLNDTEVGARFVADRLAAGASMKAALTELTRVFDGFYTLLVSSATSFAVVRDAIACKPAIVAETPDLVAVASEYRYLTGLPGIETARIFEPEPEVVYVWERSASPKQLASTSASAR